MGKDIRTLKPGFMTWNAHGYDGIRGLYLKQNKEDNWVLWKTFLGTSGEPKKVYAQQSEGYSIFLELIDLGWVTVPRDVK